MARPNSGRFPGAFLRHSPPLANALFGKGPGSSRIDNNVARHSCKGTKIASSNGFYEMDGASECKRTLTGVVFAAEMAFSVA